jgi:23S rRNA (guanosine2251-2'-O)-methyltransferase
VDYRDPVAIVVGGEQRGLRRLTREKCDHLVTIPMRGRVSSLNVSVATGILLFECLRQRGA